MATKRQQLVVDALEASFKQDAADKGYDEFAVKSFDVTAILPSEPVKVHYYACRIANGKRFGIVQQEVHVGARGGVKKNLKNSP